MTKTNLKRGNAAVRELRRIIGATQAEFAKLIGASKDSVVSWELGRSQLSRTFARRIFETTGARVEHGRARAGSPRNMFGREYSIADCRDWKARWPDSPKAAQRLHAQSADALWLVFMASVVRERGKSKYQLPAVWLSFAEWLERTRADFGLEERIDKLLCERFEELHPWTLTWGQWRKLAKKQPDVARFYRFKDDATQPGKKTLTLSMLSRPGWDAYGDMRTQAQKT